MEDRARRSPSASWRIAASIAGFVAAVGIAGDARAQATKPSTRAAAHADDPESQAAAKYQQGLALVRDGKPAEALDLLEASRKVLPSPNTDLVIGHALRRLNRRVEAIRTYQRVVESGGERVRAGEDRFRATVADAGRYFAVLKTELAEIHVTVVAPPASAVVKIDGAPVETSAGPGGVLIAKEWHEPGSASVEITSPAAPARTESASLVAGGEREVTFDFGDHGNAHPSKTPTAFWIASGVGVAGVLVFAGFGISALSEKKDLEACAPSCGASAYQAEADRGQAHQAIANVGLVVGAIGLVSAGAIWFVSSRASARATKSSRFLPAPREVAFGFGPGSASVQGRF